MALKFNLEYLSTLCKTTLQFITTLRHYYVKYPTRIVDVPRKYDSRKMYGESFLLNPKSLFDDNKTDPLYISQYIKLAGRRDY